MRPLRPGFVCECLPDADRLFTCNELFEILELAEPDRIFPPGSVRVALSNLAKQGAVKRVGRQNGQVLWAVRNFAAQESPFGTRSLRYILAELLRERSPLSVAEMVVTLQSRGYRPNADPRKVHIQIRSCMNKRLDLFSRVLRPKWALTGR